MMCSTATQHNFTFPVDVKTMSHQERAALREYSRSIPLVADTEPLDVIYEDDELLVVCKPDYLKMHPAHRFQGGTLLNRAIGHCNFAPHLTHRLDMHTTGVVVFTKTKDACKHISSQFRRGSVRKQYLAIVDGVPSDTHFTVDAPIQRDPTFKVARQIGDNSDDSKHATTEFSVLDSNSSQMSLLRAKPITGRTHQIRLHAAHAGHPIIGDHLYNISERSCYEDFAALQAAAHDRKLLRYADGNPRRAGLKLHAWKLELEHPNHGLMQFCSPPKSHFAELLQWAGLQLPHG